MPSVAAVLARIRLALRILVDPPVKAGRVLGAADVDDDTPLIAPASPCPRDSIVALDRCSLCGSADRTLVAEFNRFVHFAKPPDEDALHAHYSLCHACGVVYAARRPVGPRYRWLLEHFEETLGRTLTGETRAGKFAISSGALTPEHREHLRRLLARGVFVSEHTHPSRKEYLPALLADRLAASVHVEILGSMLDLNGRRVLEVRSRLGSISAALRRLYHAEAEAMSIFDVQRFLIEELHGIRSSRIDFDRFEVPAGGPWDLIVCNHMLTHAVHPRDLLATLRAHLTPGGHVYFYNESDDEEIVVDGKSLFSTLNAFHLQTFDRDALVRALAANGFNAVFVMHHEARRLLCLAQATEPSDAWARIGAKEFQARRQSYLEARDMALLMLPEGERWRAGDEWPLVIERAVKAGSAELSPGGKFRIRHAERQ